MGTSIDIHLKLAQVVIKVSKLINYLQYNYMKTFQGINECEDPSKNTCSKNADCVDLEVGYKCVCKKGYHDVKPEEPGRECVIGKNL